MIGAAREATASGASVLDVLWAAWTRSGLQRRWDGLSQRGGPLGAQADRDLDAVSSLFDLASEHVARTPGIGVTGLIDHIRSLALAGQRTTRLEPDAVAIVSAHAAVGREWDVVAIPGVQEGLWPNTAVRGGVLRTQELMDVLAGIEHAAHVDGSAVALAEEGGTPRADYCSRERERRHGRWARDGIAFSHRTHGRTPGMGDVRISPGRGAVTSVDRREPGR
ncbi:putative ATP-dependent DNA helicase [Mycobacteroides abscessus subsp. abscessus]|nr:putative ATP-dependent DNA helicase [Mycobacteroides abscessus subsp. abscessus]